MILEEMILDAWLGDHALPPHVIGNLTLRQLYALGRDREQERDRLRWEQAQARAARKAAATS